VTKEEYYEYLFVYMDDILAKGISPNEILTKLNRYFHLKQDSIYPPDDYLGTKLKMVTLPNGVQAWGQGCSHYIHNAVTSLEKWMENNGYKLPKKASTPMATKSKKLFHRMHQSREENLSHYVVMLTQTMPGTSLQDGHGPVLYKW
jgi:hypothetical protein